MTECRKTECQCQDHLDKATRLWNSGLFLADVDSNGRDGRTPLSRAAEKGHKAVSAVLQISAADSRPLPMLPFRREVQFIHVDKFGHSHRLLEPGHQIVHRRRIPVRRGEV